MNIPGLTDVCAVSTPIVAGQTPAVALFAVVTLRFVAPAFNIPLVVAFVFCTVTVVMATLLVWAM